MKKSNINTPKNKKGPAEVKATCRTKEVKNKKPDKPVEQTKNVNRYNEITVL